MTKDAAEPVKKTAPWKGRGRVADAKVRLLPVRFSEAQLAALKEKARAAGLSTGAFARTVLLGSPGPRAKRRPTVERAELARLLSEIGQLRAGLDRLAGARDAAAGLSTAQLDTLCAGILAMRDAVMTSLGREP